MEFKRLRCTNCGANIENINIQKGQNIYKCPRIGCGATFLIEQGATFADIEAAEAEKIDTYRRQMKASLNPYNRELAAQFAGNILSVLPDDYRARAVFAVTQSTDEDKRPIYNLLDAGVECTSDEFQEVFALLLAHSDFSALRLLEKFALLREADAVKKADYQNRVRKQLEEYKKKTDDYADVPRDVFICHKNTDIDFTMRVLEDLELDGNTCWISERNMPPNTRNYWERIKRAISRCRVFLVICSSDAMYSLAVQRELRYAEELKAERIELKIDDARHTTLFAHFFDGLTWLRADQDYDGAIARLKEWLYEVKNPALPEAVCEAVSEPKAPEVMAAGEQAVEIKEPEVMVSEANVSEAKVPEEKVPEVKISEAGIPEAKENEIQEPNIGAECAPKSESVVSESAAPEDVAPVMKAAEEPEETVKEKSVPKEPPLRSTKGDVLPDELYQKGLRYFSGDGEEQSYERAAELYTSAANAGCIRAITALGVCYEQGLGVRADVERAVLLYKQAAELGDEEAVYNLGVCYQYGKGVVRDAKRAVQLFIEASDKNYVPAMVSLAWCYMYGKGAKMDRIRALVLYKRASHAGNWTAKTALGYFTEAECRKAEEFERRENTKKTEPAAKPGEYRYLIKNAGKETAALKDSAVPAEKAEEKKEEKKVETGDRKSESKAELGLRYQYGRGVKKDYARAVQLYREAVEEGDVPAMVSLGWCYQYGVGIPRNMKKAIELYERAAKAGNMLAVTYLEYCQGMN